MFFFWLFGCKRHLMQLSVGGTGTGRVHAFALARSGCMISRGNGTEARAERKSVRNVNFSRFHMPVTLVAFRTTIGEARQQLLVVLLHCRLGSFACGFRSLRRGGDESIAMSLSGGLPARGVRARRCVLHEFLHLFVSESMQSPGFQCEDNSNIRRFGSGLSARAPAFRALLRSRVS